MKQKFTLLFIAIFSFALFTSCSNDKDEDEDDVVIPQTDEQLQSSLVGMWSMETYTTSEKGELAANLQNFYLLLWADGTFKARELLDNAYYHIEGTWDVQNGMFSAHSHYKNGALNIQFQLPTTSVEENQWNVSQQNKDGSWVKATLKRLYLEPAFRVPDSLLVGVWQDDSIVYYNADNSISSVGTSEYKTVEMAANGDYFLDNRLQDRRWSITDQSITAYYFRWNNELQGYGGQIIYLDKHNWMSRYEDLNGAYHICFHSR